MQLETKTTTTTASQQRQNRKPFSNIPCNRSHYPPLPPSIHLSVCLGCNFSFQAAFAYGEKKLNMQKKCETVPGRTHDRHPSRGNVFFYFLKFQIRISMLPRQPFFVGTRPKGFRHNLRRRRTFNLHFVGISKIKFLTYPRRSGSGVHVFFISIFCTLSCVQFFGFAVVFDKWIFMSCSARFGSAFYFFHLVTPCKG